MDNKVEMKYKTQLFEVVRLNVDRDMLKEIDALLDNMYMLEIYRNGYHN